MLLPYQTLVIVRFMLLGCCTSTQAFQVYRRTTLEICQYFRLNACIRPCKAQSGVTRPGAYKQWLFHTRYPGVALNVGEHTNFEYNGRSKCNSVKLVCIADFSCCMQVAD